MTRILEVEEDGTLTLPPELLGDARPHTRYLVKAEEGKLVLQPEAAALPTKTLSWEEWWADWKTLSDAVTHSSITKDSAVEMLSEMRR